jgi:tetratricopeptide (TPR) repeat protein
MMTAFASRMFSGFALPASANHCLCAWPRRCIGLLALVLSSVAFGQQNQISVPSKASMQQHYDAAFKYQGEGNIAQADREYKLFLAAALHHIANGRANLGEYSRAEPVFEQAVEFAPDDRELQIDYAGAALDASDWKRAKDLATAALDSLKRDSRPPAPRAVSILAQALMEIGAYQEAIERFKLAVQLQPGFNTSAALATAYLILEDQSNAAKILSQMPERFGNTAAIHMQIGILYGKAKFFDEAIEEFNKSVALNSNLSGVHYSLGASYMMRAGEAGYALAEPEFRKEIALNPNNPLVYAALGSIALNRHRYAEAEADLKRATSLNPQTAGTFLTLGQVYRETNRIPEAEAAFRKMIALTLDPSKNDYEVQKAHFWLGQLLIQDGHSEEGRKELDISQSLLYLKEQQAESKIAAKNTLQAPLEKTREANPRDIEAEAAFEEHAGPVIASSYDNLGVHAAIASEFADASRYFEWASQWNPALHGVDANWGRAAFAAKDYAKAVGPLSRTLALHPQDAELRSMLGVSDFMIHDYGRTLEVLEPIAATLGENPMLTLAYTGSMAIAGNYSEGMARLQALEAAHPDAAPVHCLIGQAYLRKGNLTEAAEELRTALKLDPENADAKEALARAEAALGQSTATQ